MIPCLKTIYFIINLPRVQKTGENKTKKKTKKYTGGFKGA
jgi:hypothetical protein